jgi:hypothetical protein
MRIGMTVQGLEQLAYSLALDWAEIIFGRLNARGEALPASWPGTLEEARTVVAAFSDDTLQVAEAEWLACRVQKKAVDMWVGFAETDG